MLCGQTGSVARHEDMSVQNVALPAGNIRYGRTDLQHPAVKARQAAVKLFLSATISCRWLQQLHCRHKHPCMHALPLLPAYAIAHNHIFVAVKCDQQYSRYVAG